MALPYHRGVIYAVPPEFNGLRRPSSAFNAGIRGVYSATNYHISFQARTATFTRVPPRLAPTVFSLCAREPVTPPSRLFYHNGKHLSIYLIYLNLIKCACKREAGSKIGKTFSCFYCIQILRHSFRYDAVNYLNGYIVSKIKLILG